jgi:hypothetical protein
MVTRTIELDRNDLDKSIEVLSSAAQALRLTRFERLSYQALIVSVDWIAVGVFTALGMGIVEAIIHRELLPDFSNLFGLIWITGMAIGIVALALNIPLFRRVFRERARLKRLGLSALSRSLWKESRRSRWISRAHGTLLTVAGILLLFTMVIVSFNPAFRDTIAFLVLTYFVAASVLFAARYLQNQRERMDLTANAEELKKAFQRLRQRAGKTEVVSVPNELVEQTAKIEAAQIAKERKEAILESVSSRPTGYAIAFDRDAAEQRTALDVADRIELADLVAQLSIAGTQLKPQEGMQPNKTKGNRVEIDYVVDNAARSIHVIAVRRVREVSHASVDGGSHA